MKLTQIAIDVTGAGRTIRLDRLSEKLNVVFGANGSSQTAIRAHLRHILFGTDNWIGNYSQSISHNGLNDYLELRDHSGQYRLTRDHHNGVSGSVSVQPIAGATSVAPTISQLVNGIDASTYDTFFNISISESTPLVQRLIEQIQLRFGVRPGNNPWIESQSYARWKAEADARLAQLETLRQRQRHLQSEKDRLTAEIRKVETDYLHKLEAIKKQIDHQNQVVSDRTNELNTQRGQISSLEHQISELRLRIEHLKTQYTQVPVETHASDKLTLLYQRLDDIDNQIRRWRLVQTDVHDERVRLRDEMATCDRLSIESTDHPYHASRQILGALETKIDETENFARRYEALKTSLESPENWTRVVELCAGMRDDLYSLCQELGRQYKHVRHKAAVAEMKQLRRCYHEMDENIKRLVRRRETVLEEISVLDPAGAEAVIRADHQFCECAQHEGYLEARSRYVGDVVTTTRYESIPVDWSAEQRQLEQLEIQHRQLLDSISRLESDLAYSQAELNRLIEEKNRLENTALDSLKNQLAHTNSQWLSVDQQIRDLILLIEEDRRKPERTPDTILTSANSCLSEVSGHRLTQVWIDEHRQLKITKQNNQAVPFVELDRSGQDLVCFSLITAGIRAYANKGVWVPVVIDDLFFNLDRDERIRTAGVLTQLSREGHQVILLTSHQDVLHAFDRKDAMIIELSSAELPDHFLTQPLENPLSQPRRNPDFRATQSFTPTPTPTFSTPVQSNQAYTPAVVLNSRTRIADVDLVESIYVSQLSAAGINSIEQLLLVDPEELSSDLSSRGFTTQQIDRWQAQAWLMICIPELRSQDARVLVACGLTEPEQLVDTNVQVILDRIKQYLGSSDGRRAGVSVTQYDLILIDDWKRSLERNRSQWYERDSYSRRRQWNSWSRNPQRANRNFPKSYNQPNGRDSRDRQWASRSSKSGNPGHRHDYDGRQNGSRARTNSDQNGRNGSSSRDYRFFLSQNDELGSAPSIGAKTAERFSKIGIASVADFLKADADDMATQLDYKRISSNVIEVWQNQTRLMVQIPNMRAHDVQLLVGCGITSPDEIASMDARKLYGLVVPFAESKEGLRILRNGKKPDMDEINKWIDWASNNRSLQAA